MKAIRWVLPPVMLSALFVLASLSPLACGAAQGCKKPENMNSMKCTAINSIIDCTKGELPAVVQQVGPLVSKVIDSVTAADGSVDWGHVETLMGSMSSAYGTCILGNIIEGYMNAPPKLVPGEVRPALATLKAGLDHAKTELWKLDPKTVIHTAHGDL